MLSLKSLWLRLPTSSDLAQASDECGLTGFPSSIEFIYYASRDGQSALLHGETIMCPRRISPACVWKLYVRTIFESGTSVLEFVGERRLESVTRITLFMKTRLSEYPPTHPETTIGNTKLRRYYYLVNGIYPSWRVFLDTIAQPQIKKEKRLAFSKKRFVKELKEFLKYCFEGSVYLVSLVDCGRKPP